MYINVNPHNNYMHTYTFACFKLTNISIYEYAFYSKIKQKKKKKTTFTITKFYLKHSKRKKMYFINTKKENTLNVWHLEHEV